MGSRLIPPPASRLVFIPSLVWVLSNRTPLATWGYRGGMSIAKLPVPPVSPSKKMAAAQPVLARAERSREGPSREEPRGAERSREEPRGAERGRAERGRAERGRAEPRGAERSREERCRGKGRRFTFLLTYPKRIEYDR